MTSDKREQILRAAVDLARRDGLGALSVRSAAAAAGVGATTLRHYFPSQAQLFHAVAGEFVQVTLDDQDIADASLPAAERLTACVEQFLPHEPVEDALRGWLEYYRLSFGPDATEGVRDLLLAGRRSAADVVERWLGVLVTEGHRVRGSVEEQATELLVLVDGLHLTMLTEPDRLDVAGARRLLHQHVSRTVLDEDRTA